MQVPQRIKEYLNRRGIADAVIASSGIGWTGSRISIPVRNAAGTTLFSKYRRDPDSQDGPKYTYEKGSSAELYNISAMASSDTVIITEGELDCLRLASEGIAAVSSTGGASTFREEWSGLFKGKDIVICYDNDEAGVRGALGVQRIMPDARIAWLPNFSGKDITDYLEEFGIESFMQLVASAESCMVPDDIGLHPSKASECEKAAREYKAVAAAYLQKQRELKRAKSQWHFTQVMIDSAMEKARSLEARAKYLRNSPSRIGAKASVAEAKKAPITDYISFDRSRMAKCPWHDDGTASLCYYPKDNRAFCFGGCGMKDSIDAAMLFENLSFKDAVRKLSSK